MCGKLPTVNCTVDMSEETYTYHISATQLRIVWKGMEFDFGLARCVLRTGH